MRKNGKTSERILQLCRHHREDITEEKFLKHFHVNRPHHLYGLYKNKSFMTKQIFEARVGSICEENF